MGNIGAKQLLTGFVNSFNSLLLPVEGEDFDQSQETRAILDYFRRLGLALGYYPWCENRKCDLEWERDPDWDHSSKKDVVLHLESENNPDRVSHTLHKLMNQSQADLRIGLVWAINHVPSDPELQQMRSCSDQQGCELLLIVRSHSAEPKPVSQLPTMKRSGKPVKVWGHLVRSWYAAGGNIEQLADYDWYILSPEEWGLQTACWQRLHS